MRTYLSIIEGTDYHWDFERVSRLTITQFLVFQKFGGKDNQKMNVYSASAGTPTHESPSVIGERSALIERIWNHFYGPEAERRKLIRELELDDV